MLKIRACDKFFSGQDIMILCGTLFCCIIIPFLLTIGYNQLQSLLNNIFSSFVTTICFLLMILCPIGVVLLLIYKAIFNFAVSSNPNFIKEIVLYKEYDYIKTYSNIATKIIPFDDIISFSVYVTACVVPKVRPGCFKAGLSIGNKLGNSIIGGLVGAASTNTETIEIVTNLKIIIQTKGSETIKINTLGNPLFDPNSQKLLSELMKLKTSINNFSIQQI